MITSHISKQNTIKTVGFHKSINADACKFNAIIMTHIYHMCSVPDILPFSKTTNSYHDTDCLFFIFHDWGGVIEKEVAVQ